jgi:hypothetical protein
MKKFNFFLAAILFAATSVFVSCGDGNDETVPEPNVTVTIAKPAAGYLVGETAVCSVVIASNAELETIAVTASTNGASGSGIVEDAAVVSTAGEFEKNLYSATVVYNYVIPTGLVAGSTVTLTFTVKDNDAQKVVEKTITIEDATVADNSPEISSYTAVLLGAKGNNTKGSFYDAVTNTVMIQGTATSAPSTVDIIYDYTTADNAVLFSPSDGASSTLASVLTTKNATKIGASSLTAANFDAATKTEVAAVAPTTALAKNLTEGDVIEFITHDGYKGLIKVGTIVPGASGSITITVKVQKTVPVAK